jgi:hypothetical protein
MVPSRWVALRALPQTPNGKIDRKALPAPSTTSEDHSVPETPVEELVAGIWCDVLARPTIARHDNFFALGGHSLSATQVVSRLRAAFAVDITLPMFFEAPTIAGLAEQIQRLQHSSEGLVVPPIVSVPRNHPLPLSFAQQRLWFLDQLHPDSTTYNATSAIRIAGQLRVEALRKAINSLVARHEVLRTHFENPAGRSPVQIIEPFREIPLPVEDLCRLSTSEKAAAISACIEREAHQRFDLEHGPLLRFRLLHVEEDSHVCIVSTHHIVTDGWSNSILVQELSELYLAETDNRPPQLAPLPVQYADFAEWQRQLLQGPVLEAQRSYWQNRLHGAASLALPTDHSPTLVSSDGKRYRFEIPAQLTSRLREISHAEKASLFMVVLASWQAFLSQYCGQNDIVVGTPISTRTRKELEPLIGLLLNVLIIRTNLRDDPSFHRLIHRVRSRVLEAYANQDLPFELIVSSVQPEREKSNTPLFNVMFTWHNEPATVLNLPGATWEPIVANFHGSKFDLTLSIEENPTTLSATFEYKSDLFEPSTIEGLALSYQRQLVGILERPDEPISALPLLGESEYKELLGWSEVRHAT